MDPMTSAKTYWSILKSLLSNKKSPCIPPLFHQFKYVTDFKKKAELFDSFAEQCSIINNSSELPSNIWKRADKSISTVTFTSDDRAKLIQNLDPNKAHGNDMLGIHMLKLCGRSICKPLDLIFQSCIKHREFPTKCKKANVVPVHKKSDKQIFKKSLLLMCGKIFERLLYNRLYEYFIENELISSSQSGFKPGDSCINQLLFITHDKYQSFDNGLVLKLGVSSLTYLRLSTKFGIKVLFIS